MSLVDRFKIELSRIEEKDGIIYFQNRYSPVNLPRRRDGSLISYGEVFDERGFYRTEGAPFVTSVFNVGLACSRYILAAANSVGF